MSAIAAPPAEAVAGELLDAAARGELAARIAAIGPGEALAVVAVLKLRVDATKLRNARRALEIAAIAEAVAAAHAEPAAEGLALWAHGNALYHLSRFGEALAAYRRAESFYAGGAYPLEVARLQINQVAVLQDTGAFAEALATADAARAACAAIGEPARRFLALLEMNSGAAFQQLARPAEALAAYERGRAILVELGDAVETARIDINRANVLQELGRFADAEALYAAARDTLAAAGAEQEVARAEHNSGKLAYRRGRYQEALARLEAARAGYAAIPNPLEVAKADLYRALVYRELGLYDEAAAIAAVAGATFARARTRWEQAIALIVEGVSLARLGEPQAADPLQARARRLLRAQGAFERIPPLDLDRAELTLAAGRPEQARRLAARVARQAAPADWPALAARARLVLAAARLAAGSTRPALRLAAEARDLAERHELPEAVAAHHALARAHEAAGDHAAAWHAAVAAVAAAEALRARLPLDDLRLAFLDAHQHAYHDAARLALAAPDDAVALAAVDLALSAPLPRPALPADAHAAREELRALREEWAYLQSARDEPDDAPHTAAALDARRRALELAIADLARRVALSAGSVHASKLVVRSERAAGPHPPSPSPARGRGGAAPAAGVRASDATSAGKDLDTPAAVERLRALQARLASDEALLAYAPAGDTLYALLVTRDALSRHLLPTRVAAVERLLRAWRFFAEHAYGALSGTAAPPSAAAHLAQLHAALLAPLAERIAPAGRLLVAAPPVWHDLPLAAALGPEGYLAERHELRFVAAPSSAGPAAPAPPAGPAFVAGCSDGGRLPDAPREAEAVAAALCPARPVHTLVEADVTRAAVVAALPVSAIVHIAAHAVYRPDNPLFSWARLADGPLAVADLGELSLDLRPLVVLSACETGRGRPRGGGLVGMARGFQLAGASALVASLWKIADRSTARLMADFYAALAERGPAAALVAAQRHAITRGEHPFHWAAFVCIEG